MVGATGTRKEQREGIPGLAKVIEILFRIHGVVFCFVLFFSGYNASHLTRTCGQERCLMGFLGFILFLVEF